MKEMIISENVRKEEMLSKSVMNITALAKMAKIFSLIHLA